MKIKQVKKQPVGTDVNLNGWIRSLRNQKTFAFIDLNDGSNQSGIQIVLDESLPNFSTLMSKLSTGASISIQGELVESKGKNQQLEIQAKEVSLIGECDPTVYPLQKKRHSLEFLRTIAHLRPRTNTFGAVARVRNALSAATHQFFQENDFLYINTPIITASDCEGAGEMFRVTTLNMDAPPRDEKKTDRFQSRFF